MNWLLSTIYGHTKVDIHATNMHTDFTEKSLFIMYTHRCLLYVKKKKNWHHFTKVKERMYILINEHKQQYEQQQKHPS